MAVDVVEERKKVVCRLVVERKSGVSGKGVVTRVDLGGRRNAKKQVLVESLVKYHPCCICILTQTVIRFGDRVWWVV